MILKIDLYKKLYIYIKILINIDFLGIIYLNDHLYR
jgi:hypothetical protein